jgi:hypothetical protein
MRTGGQTNMAKLIVAFRNSANVPKITIQIKLNVRIEIIFRVRECQ